MKFNTTLAVFLSSISICCSKSENFSVSGPRVDIQGQKVGDDGPGEKNMLQNDVERKLKIGSTIEEIKITDFKVYAVKYFKENKLAWFQIDFPSGKFNSMIDIYKEKLGRDCDDIKEAEISNIIKGKFKNKIASWETPDGRIVIYNYFGNINDGCVMLETEQKKEFDLNMKDEETGALKKSL